MSSQATRSRALPHRRQKTDYKSPSTLKHSQERLDEYILKMDNLEFNNEVVKPVKPSDKPQQKMNPLPSKPMTLQDLKDLMSSTQKEMQVKRENEFTEEIEKRKKERLEDLEKLRIMLGLPP